MCDVHSMNRKQTSLILAMATVIQLPLLFIGIDLADTGFYMTFYDQIFKAPGSVEYNFMYYLTGIVGGVWHAVWPGVFSLRVLGMLVNLWTVWVLTRIIQDWRAVMLSVAIILFGLYTAPMTFNYDTLTSALTVTGFWFMLRTSDGGWKWPLFAGIIMGINVFSRISNIAGLGYILYYLAGAIWEGRRMLRGAVWYAVGWLTGVGLVLLLMACLNHLCVFEINLKELFSIAGASEGEASHGLGNLMTAQIHAWYRILKFTCVSGVLLMVFLWVRKNMVLRVLRIAMMIIVAVVGFYVIYMSSPVTVAVGISLAGCIATFVNSRNRYLWNVALCSLLMMFIMPLGSDGGIYNNGTLVAWLSLTVAMACLVGGQDLKVSWLVPGFGASAVLTCVFCLMMMVYVVRNGVYFDDSHIGDKLVKVSGHNAYTSLQRGKLIDSLVSDLKRYVHPGDTLMVYGSGPTLNYLTQTRPWLGCSWPEQFMASSLRHRLNTAEGRPVIAILRFNTLGPHFGIPSVDFAKGGDENIYHNRTKSAVLYDFLELNTYRPVYEGEYMVIYRYVNDY